MLASYKLWNMELGLASSNAIEDLEELENLKVGISYLLTK